MATKKDFEMLHRLDLLQRSFPSNLDTSLVVPSSSDLVLRCVASLVFQSCFKWCVTCFPCLSWLCQHDLFDWKTCCWNHWSFRLCTLFNTKLVGWYLWTPFWLIVLWDLFPFFSSTSPPTIPSFFWYGPHYRCSSFHFFNCLFTCCAGWALISPLYLWLWTDPWYHVRMGLSHVIPVGFLCAISMYISVPRTNRSFVTVSKKLCYDGAARPSLYQLGFYFCHFGGIDIQMASTINFCKRLASPQNFSNGRPNREQARALKPVSQFSWLFARHRARHSTCGAIPLSLFVHHQWT